MLKISYDEMLKLETNATRKLITFVKKEVEIEEILDEVNFAYPFFQDENNRLAFNVWLSIDYINDDGKSFIDRFLDKAPKSLKPVERDILIQKNKSYVSLFEILGYEEDFMLVRDILRNMEYKLWEPNLNSLLNEGEFIFGRVGKILEEFCFIGDINYLPFSAKSKFVEDFLMDFNNARKENPLLKVEEYLKKKSLELFQIYNNCIVDALENNEDITSYLYDEVDEFEGYLQYNTHALIIRKHLSNLIEFFEYYLVEEDLTLYDMDKIDFKHFFKISIEDGFISSQEDFNSYLDTFKKYIRFLNNKTSDYKEVYLELLEISKDRFYYMNKLKALSTPFGLDKGLIHSIGLSLNEKAISLIIDLDKFVLYALDRPIELTAKKKYIKRKYLLELEDLFEEGLSKNIKSPNQEDLPAIHLFYKFSLKLGLMIIDGNHLLITKKGASFIRLKDEEKFGILFNFIWGNNFISDVTDISPKVVDLVKDEFVGMILSSNPNYSYPMSTIVSKFEGFQNFFVDYHKYLEYLGLIKTNFYPQYTFEVSNLGKAVFKYLSEKKIELNHTSIVHLDKYRKNK